MNKDELLEQNALFTPACMGEVYYILSIIT